MLLNIQGIGGLIAVVAVMLIVLLLYFTIGLKQENAYKSKKRRAIMKKANDMKFNTVEELDSYVEKELQKELFGDTVEPHLSRKERKLEKRMAKAAKKEEKRNKKAEKKAVKNSNETANVYYVENGKSVAEETPKTFVAKEQPAAEPEKADEQNVWDKGMSELAAEINTDDIQQLINQNSEQTVAKEKTVTEADLEKQFADLNEDDKAEKIADMLLAALEKEESGEPVLDDKKVAYAETPTKAVDKKADVVKKIIKKPASNVTYIPKDPIIDESDADVDGNQISLGQIKELLKSAALGPDTEEFSLNRDTSSGDIDSATPYVHSIPRILNTKEAIAVSKNAPKVTTFYPDGKVVRDNRLMTKNSFYDEKEENKKPVKEEVEVIDGKLLAEDEKTNSVAEEAEVKATEKTEAVAETEPEIVKEKTDVEVIPEEKAESKGEEAENDLAIDLPISVETAEATKDVVVEAERVNEIPVAETAEMDIDLPVGEESEMAETETDEVLEDVENAPTKEEANQEIEASEDTVVLPIGDVKKAVAAAVVAETLVEETSQEKSTENDIMMPEKPKAFGYKMAWLAIPNMGSAEVLKALDLKNIAPANWTSGLNIAYQEQNTVFVTPNIHGWTLVVGRALWNRIDLNQPIEKMSWLQKLADSFLEVFYFTSMSELNSNGWLYLKDGRLIRAYGYSGELDEVMWNFGPMSREEHSIIQGFAMGKTKVVPTEKDVLALAASWSVDTTFTNDNSRPDIGFVGRF